MNWIGALGLKDSKVMFSLLKFKPHEFIFSI